MLIQSNLLPGACHETSVGSPDFELGLGDRDLRLRAPMNWSARTCGKLAVASAGLSL
jgi:hypothetical protein